MNKRIAVFSTAWNGEVVGEILAGMSQKVKETKDDLFIFNTFGGYEGDDVYNNCEYNIFNLALLGEIDAALILSNNVYASARLAGIIEGIRKKNIPVINIEKDIPSVHFSGTDNYAAMTAMVEHLILVHNCKSFNYVGGPADNIENMQRRKAFEDTLDRYHIAWGIENIREYSFVQNDGKTAYESFAESGLAVPDAVVCANDEMAKGYIRALEKHGYKVPENVRVTGFDNTFDAQSFQPSIASVDRNNRRLGEMCIEQILGMLEGKEYPHATYAPFALNTNQSCGCQKCMDERIRVQKKYDMNYLHLRSNRYMMSRMERELLVCQNGEQMNAALSRGLYMMNISKCNIMINADEFSQKYTSKYIEPCRTEGFDTSMVVAFHNQPVFEEMPPVMPTSQLLPDGYLEDGKDSHTVFFLPLHLKGRLFGYCVAEDLIDMLADSDLFFFINNLNLAVEIIRQNAYTFMLSRKFEQMYLYDAMTGAYNRFALKNLAEPLMQRNTHEGKRTLFMFADMDGLKKINDTYGHDTGDLAIKVMAETMNEAGNEMDFLCIRYGGDEFILVGTCQNAQEAEIIKQNILHRLSEISQKYEKLKNMSLSIGYILTDTDSNEDNIDEYINRADAMMYKMKKERKQKTSQK